MQIVPFESVHATRINTQANQRRFFDWYSQEHEQALKDSGPVFTALIDDQVMFIGGLYVQWDGRAIAWSIVSQDAGKHMIKITRAVGHYFTLLGIKRIEAYIDPNFPASIRWIKMLGFEFEGRMKAFSPDGRDFDLYARIN